MVSVPHVANKDIAMMQTEELLRILACPRCYGELRAETRDGETLGLACAACAVVYPVRDDIPVMLVEEAVPLEDWRREHPGA